MSFLAQLFSKEEKKQDTSAVSINSEQLQLLFKQFYSKYDQIKILQSLHPNISSIDKETLLDLIKYSSVEERKFLIVKYLPKIDYLTTSVIEEMIKYLDDETMFKFAFEYRDRIIESKIDLLKLAKSIRRKTVRNKFLGIFGLPLEQIESREGFVIFGKYVSFSDFKVNEEQTFTLPPYHSVTITKKKDNEFDIHRECTKYGILSENIRHPFTPFTGTWIIDEDGICRQ